MSRLVKMIFIVPAAILGILLFAFIGGEIVLHLWNWLLPPLFGWRLLTFWQALGLLALCRILFGGRGWHGSGGSKFRRGMKDRIGERMGKRCGPMSSEDRDRFRQRMREVFVDSPPSQSEGDSKAQ
jgi:hypothetical protein